MYYTKISEILDMKIIPDLHEFYTIEFSYALKHQSLL